MSSLPTYKLSDYISKIQANVIRNELPLPETRLSLALAGDEINPTNQIYIMVKK